MNNSAYVVETTSRLAQWRLDNLPSSAFRISSSFNIAIWNWHFAVEKHRMSCVKLYLDPSNITRENPPVASFIIRVLSSGRDRKALAQSPEIKDKLLSDREGFVWAIEVQLPGKFIIEVEFLDLKISCPNGAAVCPYLANGLMRQRSHATALESLGKMLTEGIYTDITINASGKSIAAHRAVLVARSPVFRGMLSSDLEDKDVSAVDISDMSIEVCKALLNYLYGISKHDEFFLHRLDLLRAAHKYEINDLREACQDSLVEDINATNVLERLQNASLYQLPKLKTSCMQYLVKFGKIFDIGDDFNAFLQNADRDLVAEIIHEVLSVWEAF